MTYFKSIDNTPEIKLKEKNDSSIAVGNVINIKFPKKRFKNSKKLCKKNDEFRQNGMFCFGKKLSKISVNNKKVNNKNERKKINISNHNYNNKIIRSNSSIENKQN